MNRLTATLLLGVFPALAVAQRGAGRFPCSIVNGDGSIAPDQIQCSGAFLPGDSDPNAYSQGDGPTPVDSQCVQDFTQGGYFCGFVGAACMSNVNCDNGLCAGGYCQGGFGQSCGGNDSNCAGYLYCTGNDAYPTASDTCGGLGAFCQDARAADPYNDPEYARDVFNQFCASGYCGFSSGNCETKAGPGEDCSSDPQYKCESGLTCDASEGYICVSSAAPGPSTTTPPVITPPAGPTSTPFTVSGGVKTTKVIAAPVTVTCGSTTVASNCRAGASRARSCCTSSTATCDEIYNANVANCQTVESGYYPCSSTSAADTEECCASIYSAYFGSGGEGGDACSA